FLYHHSRKNSIALWSTCCKAVAEVEDERRMSSSGWLCSLPPYDWWSEKRCHCPTYSFPFFGVEGGEVIPQLPHRWMIDLAMNSTPDIVLDA
ncbi:hypothetical protein CPB86DRAFT_786473, partial [Serendipita vermifera]